jgi:hypothetical protein
MKKGDTCMCRGRGKEEETVTKRDWGLYLRKIRDHAIEQLFTRWSSRIRTKYNREGKRHDFTQEINAHVLGLFVSRAVCVFFQVVILVLLFCFRVPFCNCAFVLLAACRFYGLPCA